VITRSFAHLSAREQALSAFSDVVRDGFFCYPAFASDPWLDGLRAAAAFENVVSIARARHEAARQSFDNAAGNELLSVRI
jgi:hypothetical protein